MSSKLSPEEIKKTEEQLGELDKEVELLRKKRIELNSKLAQMDVSDYTMKDRNGNEKKLSETWESPVLIAQCGLTDLKTLIRKLKRKQSLYLSVPINLKCIKNSQMQEAGIIRPTLQTELNSFLTWDMKSERMIRFITGREFLYLRKKMTVV